MLEIQRKLLENISGQSMRLKYLVHILIFAKRNMVCQQVVQEQLDVHIQKGESRQRLSTLYKN